MSTAIESMAPWWQEREIDPGEGVRLSLGPLELSVFRMANEWQLSYSAVVGEEDSDGWRLETRVVSQPESQAQERYAASGGRSFLRCLPTLPDRAVVVRPRIPLFLPPDQAIQIFVSSPVWLRVEAGKPWQRLRELPTKRLSDTWFGDSTREGELAYALRTQARMNLSEIPVRPYRAVTPVIIRNRADETLAVERLNLPVSYLSVYATPAGRLWTDAVVMSRDRNDEMASLKVSKGAPAPAGEAERLTEPRATLESNVLVRAFSSLLHPFVGDTDD